MENEGSPSAVSPKAVEGIGGWIESVIITTSQTSVGQTVFKLIDTFLWVVEKSAQWSLPSHEITAAEENGKTFGKIELVRPLPWILFLPGLVILRIIRGGLNIGAFVLGYPRIQPSGMVRFMQKSRRRLRAFNLKAVKSVRRKMNNNKDKRLSMVEARKALIKSIKLTLSTLSCLDTSKSSPSPPPMKIHISSIDLDMAATPIDEKSTTESAGSPMHTDAKRKYSEISSDEESNDESESETLQSKIDRLALDDSTDDPDFNPADCSTQSSTTSSENDEKNMSLSELEDVKKEAQEFFNEKKNEEKPVINSNQPEKSPEKPVEKSKESSPAISKNEEKKEDKDNKDNKGNTDNRENKEVKEIKDNEDNRENKEVKEIKDNKDNREHKEIKEIKDSKDNREHKEIKDSKDNREHKEIKEIKDSKENREHREMKEIKDSKDNREHKEIKEIKDSKDNRENKEIKDSKDNKRASLGKAKDGKQKNRVHNFMKA